MMQSTLIVTGVFKGTSENWPVRTVLNELIVTMDGVQGDRDSSPGKRPVSVITTEDLAVITGALNSLSGQLVIPSVLRAGDIGVNIELTGMERFSYLEGGYTLHFSAPDGTAGPVLVLTQRMTPCRDMGDSLARRYPGLHGELFPKAATTMPEKIYRRGHSCNILTLESQIIRPGDIVTLIAV